MFDQSITHEPAIVPFVNDGFYSGSQENNRENLSITKLENCVNFGESANTTNLKNFSNFEIFGMSLQTGMFMQTDFTQKFLDQRNFNQLISFLKPVGDFISGDLGEFYVLKFYIIWLCYVLIHYYVPMHVVYDRGKLLSNYK